MVGSNAAAPLSRLPTDLDGCLSEKLAVELPGAKTCNVLDSMPDSARDEVKAAVQAAYYPPDRNIADQIAAEVDTHQRRRTHNEAGALWAPAHAAPRNWTKTDTANPLTWRMDQAIMVSAGQSSSSCLA
jgi:hypothetical protein